MTDQIALTDDQRVGLDIAQAMAMAGVPVFTAERDPAGKGHNDTGFWLPSAWQRMTADPDVVGRWRPGMALCAVMGHGVDAVDVDPRNGGDPSVMNGSTPISYGVVVTPSGGLHSYIRGLGVAKHTGVYPGIDIQAGAPDGSGRGFVFLPPTERPSKVTGEVSAYRWIQPLDVTRLMAATKDTSGAALAERIRGLRAQHSGGRTIAGPDWWRAFMLSSEPQSQAAAERAINQKLAEVAQHDPAAGTGFRTVLMRAALTLGGYVGGGYLDEDIARERLREAIGAVWGAPDTDDELWIDQGLADGQGQPFHVYTPEDELAWQATQARATGAPPAEPEDGSEPPWNVYTAVGAHPFDPTGDGTDQGLAEAVAQRMYPALRFGVDSGTWLVRGQKVWREREDMSGWAVACVARLMPMGQTPIPKEPSDRTELHWQAHRRQFFMSSAGSSRVERKFRAIVRNADHPAGVELAHLDADPEVLWAGGQAWNLRACLELPVPADVDPATPHLHTARCAPDARETPLWDAFVASVFPDLAVRTWALRVLSVALAGYPDAVLPVLYGPERTGKTALVSLLVDALGTYGHAADPRLLGGADNAHASVVYALKGRRLSFIDEGPRRGHLATERLKQLTGGGALTGNAMRSNPVTFLPTHTLVMTTNDDPPITDPALRARMRIIPCDADKTLVRAARQALTPKAWNREAPGVLAKMMAECASWLADQDTAAAEAAPASLRAVVDEMAAAQDPIQEWVENCTVPANPGTQARSLHRSFLAWHDLQPGLRRVSPASETAFGRRLTELGYPVLEGQGPRKKDRYRPLSVMNGSPGAAIMPTSYPNVVPMVTPTVAGSPGPQPSASENPSSDPVSSSFADSADSSSSSIEDNINTSPKRSNTRSSTTEIGSAPRTLGDMGGQNGSDQVPRVGAETLGENGFQPPGVSRNDHETRSSTTCGSSPSVVEGPLHPERAEVARIADEQGLTKPEARALLKAEQRAVAIREASGEVLELPAVVDRAGHVLAISPEQAAAVVRAGLERTGGALTVDVETSGYPVGHQLYTLRTVQLGDEVAAVVLDPSEHAELIRDLLAESTYLHAHSAVADLVPLAEAGLIDANSGWARMYDTVIPAKLGDPKSTGSDPGLKQLASAVLGGDATAPAADEARTTVFKVGRWLTGKQKFANQLMTPIEKNGWANIESGSQVMLRYAASDVLDTAALARRLPPVEPAVLQRERLAEEMTARVARHDRGLRIDQARLRELTAEHETKRTEAGQRVCAFGVENPGSTVQVAQSLIQLGAQLPVSDKGNPSVAEHVLSILVRTAADTPAGQLAQAVLDYRHSQTVLGLFLAPYAALCEYGDGRMRPTVYTLGTDTGRMSCVRPNAQQLPREGGVRSVVMADPGHVLVSADFSGVELRGAAALSQDQTMMHMIAEEDAGRFDGFHWAVARQAFGPDATKADRYTAKRGVFGHIYGGGIATLSKQVGVPESEMAAIVESLKVLTPGLAAWSDQLRMGVRRGQTQMRSYSGRVIHFPSEYPHKAPNYAIQGSCRELLVDALVRWRDTRWGDCTLLPVHDELIVMVPAEDAEAATAELVRCMESELYGVKIVADPGQPPWVGSPFWRDAT